MVVDRQAAGIARKEHCVVQGDAPEPLVEVRVPRLAEGIRTRAGHLAAAVDDHRLEESRRGREAVRGLRATRRVPSVHEILPDQGRGSRGRRCGHARAAQLEVARAVSERVGALGRPYGYPWRHYIGLVPALCGRLAATLVCDILHSSLL